MIEFCTPLSVCFFILAYSELILQSALPGLMKSLPMPVSTSGVSGISARHFRNCRSFDEL